MLVNPLCVFFSFFSCTIFVMEKMLNHQKRQSCLVPGQNTQHLITKDSYAQQ